ncbi:MAG TPA: ABC transporter permease [Puia sp.]|nr:ABC transporter permease [Puia sp.]
MLKNYLIIAWRNLLRNRTLSIINLFGLSVSVAFCLLLFFYIRWEQSYDRWHAKRDRLYRCEMSSLRVDTAKKPSKSVFGFLTRGNDEKNDVTFPLIVGPALKNALPEVVSFTRLRDKDGELVRAGNAVHKEEQVIHADGNFFSNFSFRLLKGDPRTVLKDPNSVVLSASTARKYFGDGDAVGKTIYLIAEDNLPLRVSGVAADAPANSSLQFGLVIPVEADPDYAENLRERFNQMNHYMILELQPGTDKDAFEKKMNTWMRIYFKPSIDSGWNAHVPAQVREQYHWSLRPFADCHYNVSGRWGHFTDAKAMYQLACIVVVILLLASLNYVLITVANAAARQQEVGVRKVLGAQRKGIILQSWIETQLTTGIAVGIGTIIAWACVPLLRSVMGAGIGNADISFGELAGTALALAVLLGLLAGYYPALLISRLKPLSIIKSFSTFRVNPRFSRVLITIQFTCCVVLMMAAFVIDRQMDYVRNKDLGFDKDQMLIVRNPTWDRDFTARVRERIYAFARTQSSIMGTTSLGGEALTGAYNTYGFVLNGQREWMKQVYVDFNYFGLLGLKIVEGRGFSRDYPMDTARKVRAVVVNESMMKLLGKDAKIGVFNEAIGGTIIGVVKDYNFESLTQKIGPQEHRLIGSFGDFVFKVKGGQMQATIAALEKEWKTVTNNYPFAYAFLDAAIAKMYEADLRAQYAMEGASFFAIVIACMGLFGLSAITAANRTREIGIRKVLGASVRELVTMLSAGFLSMVVLAIVIAVPLAWWLMNKWLEDFAYRVEIRWWMFGVVGLMAVGIALATVSFQVLRAARANPIDALRSE